MLRTTKSKWSYVINSKGIVELTLTGWKIPYWSVFWYNENEIAFAFRNPDIAINWIEGLHKTTYDSSWNWYCKYKRDNNLNELWISYHIPVEVTKRIKGDRRELYRTPIILKRVSESTITTQQSSFEKNKKQSNDPLYNILRCERESGSDFAYHFVLELTGGDKSLRAFRSVQKEFRAAVKEDYVESFPSVDARTLFIDFPEYKLDNGKITGRAVVLTISVASLTYDPNTRTGKLAVKVNANQYEEARKWIRKNIETLARDKNIALTTGEIPPAAKFYLGREELKDGNVLEIEFKTE